MIVENLCVAAEFNAHVRVVRAGLTGDNGGRTETGGDAMMPWEKVEATDNVDDKTTGKKFGQAAVREAVDAGTEVLFDGSDGAFDLADVTVRRNDVEMDGEHGKTSAFKFGVGVYVTDEETTGSVQGNDGAQFGEDGVAGAVGDGRNCAETDVSRDGV